MPRKKAKEKDALKHEIKTRVNEKDTVPWWTFLQRQGIGA